MKIKKLLALICCLSIILSAVSLSLVFTSAESSPKSVNPATGVTILDLTASAKVATDNNYTVNTWYCGNDDAVSNPLSGYGLGSVWGHITVTKDPASGLVLKNNGNDGNPPVLRYSFGSDNRVIPANKGIEVPVNSYLEISAVADQNFNIAIPFYFDSAANNGTETGFITLATNAQGKIIAKNSSSADAYACKTVISAGTITAKIPLYDILTANGTKNVSAARIYSFDYLAKPASGKAYTTSFKKLAITADTLNITDYASAGTNGATDMYKWYKDETENGNYFGHKGFCVNPLNDSTMKVLKENNSLVIKGNSTPDFLRLKFAGTEHGTYPSTIILNESNYLNYSIVSNAAFKIAFHVVADQMNSDQEAWKMRTIYLKNDSNGKLAVDVKGVEGDAKSSYLGDSIPAGTYSGYGIDLSALITAGDANIKSSQLLAISVWTEESPTAQVTINELSIGKATKLLDGISYNDCPVTINDVNLTANIEVPFGTDVKSILPVFTLAKGAAVDKTTAQDFTSPVAYTITKNGISQVYTVSVTIASQTDCTLISGKVLDVEAVINEPNKTVVFNLPYGTDVSALTPEFKISAGATIDKTTAQDFSNSKRVEYVVTSADKSAKSTYSVYVLFSDAPAPVVATAKIGETAALIDNIDNKISFILPYASSLKDLEPVFTFSTPNGTTSNITGKQDFTNPIKYTFTSGDGKASTEYTVSATTYPVPNGLIDHYLFDSNDKNWVKTEGGDTSNAKSEFKNDCLEITNTGGKWLNVGYSPLFENDIELNLNTAPYFFYDINDTGEFWNIIIELKDSNGKTSVINLNKYLAYQKGKKENINIPDDGGFINFKTACRFGNWVGKIKVADMIAWAYSSEIFDTKNMMSSAPADGKIFIDNITLHIDNGGNLINRKIIVRTLGFDNESGSNLKERTAIAGTYNPDFDVEAFSITNQDSTAKIGNISYNNNVLKITKLGSGWVNFVGTLKSTFNVNYGDSSVKLNYTADDVHRIYIKLTNDKCNSININLTQYIASLAATTNEYLPAGTYSATYKIYDLIKFQSGKNGTNISEFLSANGAVTVSEISFNMEGDGDKNLQFNTFEFKTSDAISGTSPKTGDTSHQSIIIAFTLIIISCVTMLSTTRKKMSTFVTAKLSKK